MMFVAPCGIRENLPARKFRIPLLPIGMMYYPTRGQTMPKSKIAVTIDVQVLSQVDRLVKEKAYPNRSRIVEEALTEKLSRMDRSRLMRELNKIEIGFERAMADEGLAQDRTEWPEY